MLTTTKDNCVVCVQLYNRHIVEAWKIFSWYALLVAIAPYILTLFNWLTHVLLVTKLCDCGCYVGVCAWCYRKVPDAKQTTEDDKQKVFESF